MLSKSPLSVTRFRYTFFGWWIIWFALQVLLIVHYGYPLKIALVDSVVTNDLQLAACWQISNILRYYLPHKDRFWYVLFLSIVFGLIVTAVSQAILRGVYSKSLNADYISFLMNSFWIRLGVAFLLVGCMTVISVLWYIQAEEQVKQAASK